MKKIKKKKANTLRMLQTHKYLTDKGRKVKLSNEKHVLETSNLGTPGGCSVLEAELSKEDATCLVLWLRKDTSLRCINFEMCE